MHNNIFVVHAKTTRIYICLTTKSIFKTTRFVGVSKMLDKLAKKNVIHDNKAANLKSSLAKHVNQLA